MIWLLCLCSCGNVGGRCGGSHAYQLAAVLVLEGGGSERVGIQAWRLVWIAPPFCSLTQVERAASELQLQGGERANSAGGVPGRATVVWAAAAARPACAAGYLVKVDSPYMERPQILYFLPLCQGFLLLRDVLQRCYYPLELR